MKELKKEFLQLTIILFLSLIFAFFIIMTNIISMAREYFDVYTRLPVIDFLLNGTFLYLVGLLWLLYRRWSMAEKRRHELEEIVESINPDVLMVIDIDGRIMMCSRAVKGMFGIESSEVIGQVKDKLYTEVTPQTDSEFFSETLKNGEGFRMCIGKAITREGETLYLEVIEARLVKSPGSVVLLRNISKRKQAEDALFESERRFIQLIEVLPIAVFVVDSVGRPFYCNKVAKELMGKSFDELNPRLRAGDLVSMFHAYVAGTDEIYPAERFPLLPALSGKNMTVDDMELRCGEKPITVEVSSAPIFDEKGVVTYAVATFKDITERRLTEDAIISARNFYHGLLDDFVSPIWRSDHDGNYHYFNKAWLQFTGRSLEEERGMGWTYVIHPDDVHQVMDGYHSAFAKRRPFEIAYRLRRHDGIYRRVIHCGKPFHDAEGNFAGYIGSCCDITSHLH